MTQIPTSQFPDIVPPQVSVRAAYPGAPADVVEATVAQPIEEQMNGVPGATYFKSTSANDGTYNLTVTFDIGTDPDINTVNVQNRAQLATARLPGSRAPGPGGAQAVGLDPAGRDAVLAERHVRSALPPTTRRSTSSTSLPASTASATRRCSDRSTTACGSGSTPTG